MTQAHDIVVTDAQITDYFKLKLIAARCEERSGNAENRGVEIIVTEDRVRGGIGHVIDEDLNVMSNIFNLGARPTFDLNNLKEGQYTVKVTDDFEIHVEGIPIATWESFKKLFLRLTPCKHAVRTDAGTILGDVEFAGRIYSKGVFVSHRQGFSFGYDLPYLQLNRDRKYTEDFDSHIGNTWGLITEDNDEQVRRFYELLSESAPEAEAASYYLGTGMGNTLRKRFLAQYPDHYIARSDAEVRGFSTLGVKSVLVSPALYRVLCRSMTTYTSFSAARKYTVLKSYDLRELSEEEMANYLKAEAVLRKVGVTTQYNLVVADFADSAVQGNRLSDSHFLARWMLKSPGKVLVHLINEYVRTPTGMYDYENIQVKLAQAMDGLFK